MPRNLLFFMSFIVVISSSLQAQKVDEASIIKPINTVFLAMEKGDSALLHSAFTSDAILFTVIEKDGGTTLRRETLNPFLNAIGSPHNDTWHESIWDVKIDQDGNYAQVWASYAFYIGTKFSHCGVDTFQLIKNNGEWKIFYLADTRHKTGCNIPKSVTNKYSSK